MIDCKNCSASDIRRDSIEFTGWIVGDLLKVSVNKFSGEEKGRRWFICDEGVEKVMQCIMNGQLRWRGYDYWCFWGISSGGGWGTIQGGKGWFIYGLIYTSGFCCFIIV